MPTSHVAKNQVTARRVANTHAKIHEDVQESQYLCISKKKFFFVFIIVTESWKTYLVGTKQISGQSN